MHRVGDPHVRPDGRGARRRFSVPGGPAERDGYHGGARPVPIVQQAMLGRASVDPGRITLGSWRGGTPLDGGTRHARGTRGYYRGPKSRRTDHAGTLV